jgi:hypothetical protein
MPRFSGTWRVADRELGADRRPARGYLGAVIRKIMNGRQSTVDLVRARVRVRRWWARVQFVINLQGHLSLRISKTWQLPRTVP